MKKTERRIQQRIITCCTSSQQLLKKPLRKEEPIAFVFSSRLGDTLISLVTVNNLLLNGYNVAVYSDYAYSLRDWFPHIDIRPLIPFCKLTELAAYTTVLHMDKNKLSEALDTWHPNSRILWQRPLYNAPMSMIDIQVFLCQQHFRLQNVTRENGIRPPPYLTAKKFKNRIMLHPTSSKPLKNWGAKRFIKLTKFLNSAGYDPYLIVPPAERFFWKRITCGTIKIPNFASLSDIAAWIYESSFFIGNDSGIGHLASNLSIPTVSLMIRPGTAKQWRPSWAPNAAVLPPAWLNPRPIKECLWRYFIPVSKVKTAFKTLSLSINR